jgi:hypothetical protein
MGRCYIIFPLVGLLLPPVPRGVGALPLPSLGKPLICPPNCYRTI